MSEIYSNADLQSIAKDLIDDLRECEDGTVTSTCQLLKTAGYDMDEFSHDDLFEVHRTLFSEARANHITLNTPPNDGTPTGLAYNLDFIIRNKKGQIKCPYCGSKNTARILYGLPAFSDELQRKINSGKISIGGCCVLGIPVDGGMIWTDPSRVCNDCNKKFGKPPLIIAKDLSGAEDYRDIVTSIYFSVGGYFQGISEVTITRNEKDALVRVKKSHSAEEIPEKRITIEKWYRIVNSLYSQMYLHEWKKKYHDPDAEDGEQRELKNKLTGNRRRNYGGSNAYPPYWSELSRIFRGFTK